MLWFRNDIYPNVDENFEWPIVFKKLNGNRDTINKRHIVDSRVENPKQTRCYYKAYYLQEYLPQSQCTWKQNNITQQHFLIKSWRIFLYLKQSKQEEENVWATPWNERNGIKIHTRFDSTLRTSLIRISIPLHPFPYNKQWRH